MLEHFPNGKIIHRGFDDPPQITKQMMDDKEIMETYLRVCEEIKDFVTSIESYVELNHG